MSDIKGKIKILENKIIIKTERASETWIKKTNLSMDCKEWIEFKNQVYELESFDLEDEVI